jgi:hypothetical protein
VTPSVVLLSNSPPLLSVDIAESWTESSQVNCFTPTLRLIPSIAPHILVCPRPPRTRSSSIPRRPTTPI